MSEEPRTEELSAQSAAVEPCLFRGCPWTTTDTRVTDVTEADEQHRRHLIDTHRDRLEWLWVVLESDA